MFIDDKDCEFERTILREIRPNAKRTGYVLKGDDCDAFIWKNDKLLCHLLEAVVEWSVNKTGFQMELIRDNTAKRGFRVEKSSVRGKPIQLLWRLQGEGYTCSTGGEDDTNPFL